MNSTHSKNSCPEEIGQNGVHACMHFTRLQMQFLKTVNPNVSKVLMLRILGGLSTTSREENFVEANNNMKCSSSNFHDSIHTF